RATSVTQPPMDRDDRAAAESAVVAPVTADEGAQAQVDPEDSTVPVAAVVEPAPRSRTEPLDEVPPDALVRARRLADETGHVLLVKVLQVESGVEFQSLNTALRDLYRERASTAAYSLLFELNMRPFSMIATRILRLTNSRADLGDILQETFLAIYRYPSRFCPDKPNAFR